MNSEIQEKEDGFFRKLFGFTATTIELENDEDKKIQEQLEESQKRIGKMEKIYDINNFEEKQKKIKKGNSRDSSKDKQPEIQKQKGKKKNKEDREIEL